VKSESGPSPKSQVQTRSKSDVYFEARFRPESQIYRVSQDTVCTSAGYQKRSVRV